MDMEEILEELIGIREWVDRWVEEAKEAERRKNEEKQAV